MAWADVPTNQETDLEATLRFTAFVDSARVYGNMHDLVTDWHKGTLPG